MKVDPTDSSPRDTIVNIPNSTDSDQKIKPIQKQSLLKRALKFSAIAGAGIFSLGTVFLYLAYLGTKENGNINEDTSFFDYLKIVGAFASELKNVSNDPNYKSPYLSFADCSSEVKDDLERLQKCSASIKAFNINEDSFFPEGTKLDKELFKMVLKGKVGQAPPIYHKNNVPYPALDVLGLDQNTLSQKDRGQCMDIINKTYRTLSRQFHPDKVGNAVRSQYFPLLGEAKSTLAGSDYSVCGS